MLMGTSGLTVVLDKDNEPIVCIYFQSDGYPSGYGITTAKCVDKTIINGIPLNNKDFNIANGMDCLAAQLIRDLKQDIGLVYLVSPNKFSIDFGYIYFVCFDKYNEKPYIKFFETNWDSNKPYPTVASVLKDAKKYTINNFLKKFSK